MPTDYDAIVLGCGTMGAATCLALARAGQRVLGLDRFNPPHEMGEHHGLIRMFRTAYYEDPAYVPWLKESLRAWQELRPEGEPPIMELTGALYMGRPDSELIAGCIRAARAHGLVHEVLSHAEIARRFPVFRLPAGVIGFLERDAGYIWCERAVRAMLDGARDLGAELRLSDPAIGWGCDDDGVSVGASTIFRSSKLVITAGPWSADFLPQSGVKLTVTRQVQGWLTPLDPAPYLADRLPCWAIDIGGGALFYGFPAIPGVNGRAEVKLARHAQGPSTDPDSAARLGRPEDPEEFMPLVREFLPALAEVPLRTSICLYTNSPDSHFIIDRHPRHSNVAFGCGFSGHGFKMAPAVGQILTQLVSAPGSLHPAPFFSSSRFKGLGGGSP